MFLEKFESAKLYCVTQEPPKGLSYADIVESACRGGADIIQLREKKMTGAALITLAKELKTLCHKYRTLFILNDNLDVALEVGADGVHLGQEDLPIPEAKKIVGDRPFLIGCSTHSLEQALRAEIEGADYIACGPVFSTPTKHGRPAVGLELVKKYSEVVAIPFVAIGGLDMDNIEDVLHAGAKRAAVVRAVFGAPNIEEATRTLKEKIYATTN